MLYIKAIFIMVFLTGAFTIGSWVHDFPAVYWEVGMIVAALLITVIIACQELEKATCDSPR